MNEKDNSALAADFAQGKVPFMNRAPNASDKGTLAIQFTAGSDTTLVLWARHPYTGTWRSTNLT